MSDTRIAIDSDNAQQGLARLVLAVAEILREVIEAQALARVEGGSLTADEIERLGGALHALNEAMAELVERLGVTRSQLDTTLDSMGSLVQQAGATNGRHWRN